jgi:hypothetical protein
MELTSGLIFFMLAVVYVAGLFTGAVAVYFFIVARALRSYSKRKDRVDELVAELDKRAKNMADDEPFVAWPGIAKK